MNLGKPSGKTVTDTLTFGGSAVVGGAGSRVVYGLIQAPNAAETDTNELLKRGALAAAGLLAVVAIKGKGLLVTAAKGFGAGMAYEQGMKLITAGAQKLGVKSEAEATNTIQKQAARALGLGCPCNGNTPGMARPGMRYPRYYNVSNMDATLLPQGNAAQMANPLLDAAMAFQS